MSKIFNLSIGTFKLKSVVGDTGLGNNLGEWVEVYKKVGYYEEIDPYIWIGDLDWFDIDDCTDEEVEEKITKIF